MTPWLTVIMPSYCGERWIESSLGSLAAEPMEGIEVLVIDGSPTCATIDIARSFSDRLTLRVFERRDLASWHDKTNFGVTVAKSAHLCWLGVDDLWLPGRGAAARDWIESAPQCPLHLAASAIIDSGGQTLGVWSCPLPTEVELPWAFVAARLLVQNFVAAPAPVFRKDTWLACGGLDENLWYTADWDIWLKLAARGPVLYHDQVTIGFRIHSGSLGASGSRDAIEFTKQMQIVLDRHLPQIGDHLQQIERVAMASIMVNTALAAASVGNFRHVPRALYRILTLGPAGIHRYLRDSRILDRTAPRIRAMLSGAF